MSTWVSVLVIISILLKDFTTTCNDYFYADFRCMKNVLYEINRCNLCSCGDETFEHCTVAHCDGEYYAMARNCNVGKKWKESCNQCECVEILGTACTVKECPQDSTEKLDYSNTPSLTGSDEPESEEPLEYIGM